MLLPKRIKSVPERTGLGHDLVVQIHRLIFAWPDDLSRQVMIGHQARVSHDRLTCPASG